MRMMMKVSAVLKSHDSAGLHAITLSVRPSVCLMKLTVLGCTWDMPPPNDVK